MFTSTFSTSSVAQTCVTKVKKDKESGSLFRLQFSPALPVNSSINRIEIMKVQILSDIHLEFGQGTAFDFNGVDLLILAGNVHIGKKGLIWIGEKMKDIPVIYVLEGLVAEYRLWSCPI
jgi:hypothetical protein